MIAQDLAEEGIKSYPRREDLLEGLKRAEELSAALSADLKAGAATLAMPVQLLRHGGQLLASLAGTSEQTLVSAVGLIIKQAKALSDEIIATADASVIADGLVDEVHAQLLNARTLSSELQFFIFSLKRIFKVNSAFPPPPSHTHSQAVTFFFL